MKSFDDILKIKDETNKQLNAEDKIILGQNDCCKLGWNRALDLAMEEIGDYNFIGYEDLQDELIGYLKNKKV